MLVTTSSRHYITSSSSEHTNSSLKKHCLYKLFNIPIVHFINWSLSNWSRDKLIAVQTDDCTVYTLFSIKKLFTGGIVHCITCHVTVTARSQHAALDPHHCTVTAAALCATVTVQCMTTEHCTACMTSVVQCALCVLCRERRLVAAAAQYHEWRGALYEHHNVHTTITCHHHHRHSVAITITATYPSPSHDNATSREKKLQPSHKIINTNKKIQWSRNFEARLTPANTNGGTAKYIYIHIYFEYFHIITSKSWRNRNGKNFHKTLNNIRQNDAEHRIIEKHNVTHVPLRTRTNATLEQDRRHYRVAPPPSRAPASLARWEGVN